MLKRHCLVKCKSLHKLPNTYQINESSIQLVGRISIYRYVQHYIFLKGLGFLFLKILFVFIFRQRGRQGEREGEKHQCVVAS